MVVVGAGVSGLVAARVLADAGIAVRVLERSQTVGGRIRSISLGSRVLDAGASHLWTFYRHTDRWLERTELARDLESVRGAPPHRDPLGPRQQLGAAMSILDVVRNWRSLVIGHPERAAGLDGQPMDAWARARFGAGFTEQVMLPTFEWNAFCGLGDLSSVLALQALRLLPRARPRTLRGGLHRLPAALAGSLVPEPETGREVVSVQEREGGVLIELAAGGSIEASAAVVATTAEQAGRLLPRWPSPVLDFLNRVRYSAAARRWWLGASGDDVGPIDIDFRPGEINLVAAASSTGAGSKLVAAASYLSHRGDEEPEDAIVRLERALDRWEGRLLQDLPGAHASASWPRAVALFEAGHFVRLRRLAQHLPRGRVVLAGDYLVSPLIEGAVLSGERAARALLCQPILKLR